METKILHFVQDDKSPLQSSIRFAVKASFPSGEAQKKALPKGES